MLGLRVVLLALMAVTALAAKVASDPKECEVCMKVLSDVDELIPADKKSDKDVIESAIDKHCAKKELSQKDKKMCYYMDPIKKSISQPFSLKMPKDRVCKRLKKDNPEICEVKYPVKVDQEASNEDISKLRVKQLKQILNDRGVACDGCLEKADYVKRVMETAHMDL